ncbi:MAG: RsmE family RNA methyltransferase [Acidimicrobiales bacterium]
MADLEHPELSHDDAHHLGSVLRLGRGRVVSVSDGAGQWRRCVVGGPPRPAGPRASASSKLGSLPLEPDGPILTEPPPAYPITVAFALTKAERPEWAVQRLTEAGVDKIIVFPARHSVARWEATKAPRQLDRLRKVARGAAMQSRRCRLPTVDGLLSFSDMATALGQAGALAQAGGAPPGMGLAGLAVGPEGGWSSEELDAGLPTVGLGPAVYRAEMAAVAAGVILSALRSGLVRPAGNEG